MGQLTKGVEFLFKKNKVDWIKGRGRLAGTGKVEVTAEDGSASILETRHVVIATGSEPSPLPGVTVDQQRIVNSTGALDLPETPGHLVVIGAGVIGLELGSVWRRLGAKVTVVEFLDRITPAVDEETAKTFQRSLTRQGIAFRLGARVTAATVKNDGVDVSFEPVKGGDAETISADYVLLAIGRRPFTESLGLESVGLTTDRRGYIETNHFRDDR